jgi:hypothetical protein
MFTNKAVTTTIQRNIQRNAWFHSLICGGLVGWHFGAFWLGYVTFLAVYLAVELIDVIVAKCLIDMAVTLRTINEKS